MGSNKKQQIPADISDEDLIALASDPETREEAFRFLVAQYAPMLYTVIRRILVSHDDTDDALQNTLIKVWHNLSCFKSRSKLSTWMYTIALNEARSTLRRQRAERQLPIETDTYSIAETLTGDPYFDGDEAQAKLMEAIAQLPEKQRITFELRYFEELPYSEISEITGTSVGALKANYHHAMQKLFKYLGITEESQD